MLLAQTCHVSEISLPPRLSLRVRLEVVWQRGELEGVVGENCSSPEVKLCVAGQWPDSLTPSNIGSLFTAAMEEGHVLENWACCVVALSYAECLKSDSSAKVGFGDCRGLSSMVSESRNGWSLAPLCYDNTGV